MDSPVNLVRKRTESSTDHLVIGNSTSIVEGPNESPSNRKRYFLSRLRSRGPGNKIVKSDILSIEGKVRTLFCMMCF